MNANQHQIVAQFPNSDLTLDQVKDHLESHMKLLERANLVAAAVFSLRGIGKDARFKFISKSLEFEEDEVVVRYEVIGPMQFDCDEVMRFPLTHLVMSLGEIEAAESHEKKERLTP